MNPDIQAHELADMRRFADKAPFDIQQKFHALLDAYEDSEAIGSQLEQAAENHEAVEEAAKVLEKLTQHPPLTGALSDEAWAERLEDLPNDAERYAAIHEELTRARAGEAAALARLETITEGVQSVIEDLEALKEP